MTFNLASAWEAISDTIPDHDALIAGDARRSWREFDTRAARLASALRSVGVGAGDHVALCLYNGNEYLEAQFGAMKERCAPFNVNYRYTSAELLDLLRNGDARVVFYSAGLVDNYETIRSELGDVVLFVQVGGSTDVPDWAVGYEALLAVSTPAPRIERDGKDLWILFTGGTTGQPKGVMWPHDQLVGIMDRVFAAMHMESPASINDLLDLVAEIHRRGLVTRQIAAAPLMHGTSGIAALTTLTQGGTVLTLPAPSFDADALWRCVQEQSASHLAIVGDAFCRPMVAALDAAVARNEPYDLSSMFLVLSSGVMWSAPMKSALLVHNPNMRLMDSLGSSEGAGFARKLDDDVDGTATARFELGPNTRVFTDDWTDVVPGSGERGRLALSGALPIGYYKDPVKSAETWPVIDGVRYSIPGDWATVDEDGSIMLLGRGSACINTGGEKVYPEEVEEALKLIESVVDANVVGVPDERWGQAVVAVIELGPSASMADDELKNALREHLAAYKTPKHWIRVPEVLRAPNGKSDYRWALQTALDALDIIG